MAKRKYLVLFRNQQTGGQHAPSPEEMQKMFASYKVWMEKFKGLERNPVPSHAIPARGHQGIDQIGIFTNRAWNDGKQHS